MGILDNTNGEKLECTASFKVQDEDKQDIKFVYSTPFWRGNMRIHSKGTSSSTNVLVVIKSEKPELPTDFSEFLQKIFDRGLDVISEDIKFRGLQVGRKIPDFVIDDIRIIKKDLSGKIMWNAGGKDAKARQIAQLNYADFDRMDFSINSI